MSNKIRAPMRGVIGSLLAGTVLWSGGAAAQNLSSPAGAEAPEEGGEIVVTARKRDETAISVPVTLNAVSGEALDLRGVKSLDALTLLVPQLQLGTSVTSVQGGAIFMRGIGSGEGNTTADQAISFNIDGGAVARSSVRRLAQFDVAQVEVLKGPQALFFGKNSPGGVISIRTADPTTDLEAMARFGYEVNASALSGEGYVSGALTDTLGIRIAGYASDARGWMKNTRPVGDPRTPLRRIGPDDQELGGRLTLKLDTGSGFDARFKLSYGQLSNNFRNQQYVYCALGTPQTGGGDDCVADRYTAHPIVSERIASLHPGLSDRYDSLDTSNTLSSLEMNYNLSGDLKLTSVTSLYKTAIESVGNPGEYYSYLDHSRLNITEKSQELRLASSFSGPFNFMVGGLLGQSTFKDRAVDGINEKNPTLLYDFSMKQSGISYSVFAQGTIDILDSVEISGGGRYSFERKDFRISGTKGFAAPPFQRRDWSDFSPEATIAWKPNPKLTVYGSYKRGFLSGGYNVVGTPYDQQVTQGFEGGLKTALPGGLRLNLAAYSYDTSGLQISMVTQQGLVQTVNAGKSRNRGLEGDLSWRTPVSGLTLNAAVGYSNARYLNFTTSCYPGQSIAAGCTLAPKNGVFTVQDLAGERMVHAPDLTTTVGALWETPLSSTFRLRTSFDAAYTSKYPTFSTQPPGSYGGGYWLLNGSIALLSDGGFDLAVIGNNLTNKYYYLSTSPVIATGSGTGTAGPTVSPDLIASLNQGRQIMFRITHKFK